MTPPESIGAFAYHRAVAPMMWVLMALASIELLVVHLLVSHWSRGAALMLSATTLAGMIWLAWAILRFRRLPVLLTPDALVWRLGAIKRLTVPRAAVAGLRADWDAALVRQPATLNLAALAYPNVVVDLAAPVMFRRRRIVALAHRLDDPAAFAAALAAWLR